MNILLHTCCAPCLIYPLERLKAEGFKVDGFFYNPNIHALGEYTQRKDAVASLARELELDIEYPLYAPVDFFHAIDHKEALASRCALCWELRLKATAAYAKAHDFSHFSTTLLVSPYQNQELLKSIGERIAGETGVAFYYEDFRKGFRDAHIRAKAQGIYCQKYCGCIYSEIERFTKSAGKNEGRQEANELPLHRDVC